MEQEIELLLQKNCIINKEIVIFDKKAEEATLDLLIAQEELDSVKDTKKVLEDNIDAIKFDLFSYLKNLKTNFKFAHGQTLEKIFFSSCSNEYEMRYTIKQLSDEVEAKKNEIDALKDKSQSLIKKFKAEMEAHDKELLLTKTTTEKLNADMVELEADIKLKTQLILEKNSIIETFELSLSKLNAIKEETTDKINDLEEKYNEKCMELENAEKIISKYMENIDSLRQDENDMVKSLEKLSHDICDEKENYEKLKRLINELMQNKNNLESKLTNINEIIEKVSEEYEKREQQLIKLNNLTKEKQLLVKRDKDQLAELEYQKENMAQETALLKDKYRRKKVEFDRLEQNSKLLEARYNQTEVEVNAYTQKLVDTKHQLESLVLAINEGELKLKELIAKNDSKQHVYEQQEKECMEKKYECESIEVYLEELRKEYQQEKKIYNSLQVGLIHFNTN